MLDYKMTLGHAVKKARIELGFAQNDVADLVDVDSRTVLNIENCKGNPKLEILFPLIRALDIDPNTIFYPELCEKSDPRSELSRLLSQCTNEEITSLIPIYKTIISVLRTSTAFSINEDQSKEPAP